MYFKCVYELNYYLNQQINKPFCHLKVGEHHPIQSKGLNNNKTNKNKKTNKCLERKNFLSPQLLAVRKRKKKNPLFPLHIQIQAGIYMINISSSWALRLELNYTTDIPRIPAFRQQMVKFLHLPNCMSFLI